jgi:hypothetical protein
MTTVIDGTSGSSIAGDATITGNLVVTGSATIAGQPAGGNYILRQYIANDNWTKPAGLKAVKVTVVGGGGGGGGARASGVTAYAAGKGGGGGATIDYIPAPSIPGPVVISVGTGGTGSAAPVAPATGSAAGGGGNTSSFGAFCSATGGSGANAGVAASGTPGAGGTGTGGQVNFSGGRAIAVNRAGDLNNSVFSTASQPYVTGPGAGQAGGDYGGGGTGAEANSPGQSFSGGTGAPGIVIVEEFY